MKWLKEIACLLIVMLLCVAASVYGGLYGWWLTPIAPKNDAEAFVLALKEKVRSESRGNVALVLIEGQQVIAEDYSSSVDAINRDTLFPLASMSKLFAAYGVMRLVEAGQIDLDVPVASYLTRWELPASEFDNSKVTMRQLLSHTSGLSDGLGFGDYESDEVIPSLEESLLNPRVSKGVKTIQLGREPGSGWQYSGGGYLIAQLLVEEASGMDFESWMQQEVFTPLEMNRTTYEYLGDMNNTSNSYGADGRPASIYRYASSAATGLSSTPADLVKFAKSLVQSSINDRSVLNRDSVDSMLQPLGRAMGAPIWGMGVMLYAPIPGGGYVYGHDGANDPAINTALRINPRNGDAIIVLATGSKSLASAAAYEWTLWQTGNPDFLSLDKAMRSAITPSIVGVMIVLVIYLAFLLKRRRV